MALIDELKICCDRLASRGWRDLLLAVTDGQLDIEQSSANKLKNALTTPLDSVDRSHPGFEDYHPRGRQGITPGKPSQSLLYHALASASVHATSDGEPSKTASKYATLEELDLIENFIYSLVKDEVDLEETFIAVFAYQYREAHRTSHQRYADLAFSRTGVSRVGTSKPHYDASRRSFWILPKNGRDSICVLPARYGVFLAKRAKPGTAGTVMGGHRGMDDNDFIFPVHKLFAGRECLSGKNLSIDFLEFHRNEKLRATHLLPPAEGGLAVPPGFDVDDFPYVRESTNGGDFAKLEAVGSSSLLVPNPGETLVRTVSQQNQDAGKKQVVHFIVPPVQDDIRGRETRFQTSLEIPAFGGDRLSPEYVNIRHSIKPGGSTAQKPKDLNILPEADFQAAVRDGGHAAPHFIDDSCDGCVEAVVGGLPSDIQSLPAFSLITAVDFLPVADQADLDARGSGIRQVQPLSEGRLPVNPSLPLPSNSTSFAFDRNLVTLTAIVGELAIGSVLTLPNRATNRMVSFLPDSASNVFAPGWDTSRSRDSLGTFLTSSGLGSPFPEDAKLCSALASFWPAVAPDNGRTFGNQGWGNQVPMLDEELGLHPRHELVLSGAEVSETGWDGEFGPFFEKVGSRLLANYVDIGRSDYVSHALAKSISVKRTAEIQVSDLIERHDALRICEAIIGNAVRQSSCLVVFRKIDDWAAAKPGSPQLTGSGFLLEFGEFSQAPTTSSEINRLQQRVLRRHTCQFGVDGVAYKDGSAAFRFIPH